MALMITQIAFPKGLNSRRIIVIKLHWSFYFHSIKGHVKFDRSVSRAGACNTEILTVDMWNRSGPNMVRKMLTRYPTRMVYGPNHRHFQFQIDRSRDPCGERPCRTEVQRPHCGCDWLTTMVTNRAWRDGYPESFSASAEGHVSSLEHDTRVLVA